MAAKRYIDIAGDEDQPKENRMKTKPSFASVIREVVTVNFVENFCSAVEPMIRRVVGEEVEDGLRRRSTSSIPCSPALRIQQAAPDRQASGLRLAFAKRLSQPIFTGTKVVDVDNNPLQIVLVDSNGGIAMPLPFAIKVDIVVLDGDFPSGDEWTADEFAKNIVKERTGKRPLLTGDLNITMRDQGVGFIGDIEFTDNSSWIRSRKFRIGARVQQLGGNHHLISDVAIREAVTEAFVVKDHRGELYKKHHPPALEDEVWRLEKIGKGGTFHQKLASEGINTVQDFLKLFNVDPSKLRKILGMSDKKWEVASKHAKTCVMGSKVYRFRGNNYTLILSPICQLINVEINGQVYSESHFNRINTGIIDAWVKDAYSQWNSLEEVDVQVLETPLLTQGEIMVGHQDHEYPTFTNNNINNDPQIAVRPVSSDYVGGQMQNNGDYHDHGNYIGWAASSSSSGFYLSSTTTTTTRIHKSPLIYIHQGLLDNTGWLYEFTQKCDA